jgi:hypothetical protein
LEHSAETQQIIHLTIDKGPAPLAPTKLFGIYHFFIYQATAFDKVWDFSIVRITLPSLAFQ